MIVSPYIYPIALVPVIVVLLILHRLRKCLLHGVEHPAAFRKVMAEMLLIICAAPFLLWGLGMAEMTLDPDFLNRSFRNPELANGGGFLLFCIEQTLMGIWRHAAGTFGWDISNLEYVCTSPLFCLSLSIYRSMIGIATSLFVLSFVAYINMLVCQVWTRITAPFRRSKQQEAEAPRGLTN